MFGDISRLNNNKTRRVSTWDRRGMNRDYVTLDPGETKVLADIKGPGRINHVYAILIDPTNLIYRKMVIRMFWDNEKGPSVEVPLGDFFCVSHCVPRSVKSLMVTVNSGNLGKWCPVSYGLNAYFPMPFSERAYITLEYEKEKTRESYPLMFWSHIDYEEGGDGIDFESRFHAQWRREKRTKSPFPEQKNITLWDGVNLTGEENFLIMEARGKGQVVGVHLQVDNIAGAWWGEGDDMIFVDGDKWPPTIHGTGTEEIFGGGACPCSEYSGPYTGFHLIENENFEGKNGMYKWYLTDPIRFNESISFTIEHGHANNYENDYSSVAYWYQAEPHAPIPRMPSVEDRLPRVPESLFDVQEKILKILRYQDKLGKLYGESDAFGTVWGFINGGAQAIREKRYLDALGIYAQTLELLRKGFG